MRKKKQANKKSEGRKKSDPAASSGAKEGRRGRRRAEKGAKRHEGGGGGRTYVGKFEKNSRGFGFLIPEFGEFKDVYVHQRDTVGLMDGDKVEFRLGTSGGRPAAKVSKVLSRGQKKIVGEVVAKRGGFQVRSSDGEFAKLDSDRGVQEGDWIVGAIEKYPTPKTLAEVSLESSLGNRLGPESDVEIATIKYGLPTEFRPETIKFAERARKLAAEEIARVENREFDEDGGVKGARRIDLRDRKFVTIDGEDAKDFDDAVLVEREGNSYILSVAIADVSFFVIPGSSLDEEALERSTSVYFPGVCIPMLPESLSNDLCSLRPREDKLAMVAEIEYDVDGVAQSMRFYRAVIRTAERLTYTQVQKFLEGEAGPKDPTANVARELKTAHELYKKLARKRAERYALDFDLPETRIEVDKKGVPVRVFRAPRWDAHKLIEEFMIAANRVVARALEQAKIPSLYRVHEPPDPDRINALSTILREFGVQFRFDKITPREFAELLEATHELPSVATLHQAILRSQKQAHYGPEPKGHFGLALRDYTHFTSPIRRYPDVVVHRALGELIERKAGQRRERERGELGGLEAVGKQTSERERRAMEAERFVVRRKQCWYLQNRVGELFDATVTGLTENGLFVILAEVFIEGFVPAEFLAGDFAYEERSLAWVQRPRGLKFTVGSPLRVELLKISVEQGQITLGRVNP